MKSIRFSISMIFASLFLLFSGCEKTKDDQTGSLILKITDSPFPIELIEEANVTITKVEIRHESDTIGDPFLTLLEDTLEFKLLELRNGVTADLLEMEIPAGNYDLLRLYVDNANLKVKDGDTYDVKVPSGAQTGIKIFIKPSVRIAGGSVTEILLDFNVDKSFVLKGNMMTPAGIKGFNFNPVIRAVNNTTAGTVEGLVFDPDTTLIPGAAVWIEKDTLIATAYTGDDGYYAIPGIPAGTYSMSASKEGFDTVSFDQVEVIEGNVTVQEFVLSPLSE